LPTVVRGKDTVDPVRGACTGEPKTSTWPSAAPTYSRPLCTAGTENFVPVPSGKLFRRTISPLTGTASYARSWAPTPPPVEGNHTVHARAEPEVVPSEVTTGAPEPKP